MRGSARTATPLLVAVVATAAGAAIAAAAPAFAAPDDSADSPAVPPVVSTIDGMWNEFVRPNAIVPRSPLGTWAQQFGPTTGQVRNFFGFIQQLRVPAPITAPAG